MISFYPLPVIRTERLMLRSLNKEDEHNLFALRSDESVNQYIDRDPPASIEDVSTFIDKINTGIKENKNLYWVIEFNNEFAGTICMFNLNPEKSTAEIGYELLPKFQNKGLMKEAVNAVLEFGFDELQLERIDGCCHIDNERSIQVLKKFQFARNTEAEAEMDEAERNAGLIIYSLFKKKLS